MSYYRERDRQERGFYRERPERRVSIMVRNLPKSIRWGAEAIAEPFMMCISI
jgi:hypothetical protein